MDITSGLVLHEQEVTFDNSSLQNTQKEIIFEKQKSEIVLDNHELLIHNPSDVTDLTVKIFSQYKLNDEVKYALISKHTISKTSTDTGTAIDSHILRVQNMFLSGNCKIVISNNTSLGSNEGFTTYLKITEII